MLSTARVRLGLVLLGLINAPLWGLVITPNQITKDKTGLLQRVEVVRDLEVGTSWQVENRYGGISLRESEPTNEDAKTRVVLEVESNSDTPQLRWRMQEVAPRHFRFTVESVAGTETALLPQNITLFFSSGLQAKVGCRANGEVRSSHLKAVHKPIWEAEKFAGLSVEPFRLGSNRVATLVVQPRVGCPDWESGREWEWFQPEK